MTVCTKGLAVCASLLLGAGALQAQVSTTVSGELRLRTEALRTPVGDEWDSFTLQRARLGLGVAISPRARLFVQLQDARVFGEETSTADGSADALDLHQGWLELTGTVGAQPLAFRAGRQEIILGNERLVGAVGWSNTGRSFDAARLTLGPTTAVHGGLMLATIREGGTRFGEAGRDGDHWFSGVFVGGPAGEVYGLYDNSARYGVYRDVDRATVGLRLQSPTARQLFGSVEAAYQFGSQDLPIATAVQQQDIRAAFAGLRAGVTTGLPAVPSLGIGLDYLSGDGNVRDDDYRAFNTLYATNHKFYGYMDLFLDPAARTGGRGLVDAIGSTRAGLGRIGTVDIDLHHFRLAEQGELDSSVLGWELDLTYPFRVAEVARFTVGYSLFRNGAAAPAINLGADGRVWHWGFVQASLQF